MIILMKMHIMIHYDSERLLDLHIAQSGLRTSRQDMKYKQKSRSNKAHANDFTCQVIPLWNNIPLNIKAIQSPSRFKKDLLKWFSANNEADAQDITCGSE
jgi:hypothetical protein